MIPRRFLLPWVLSTSSLFSANATAFEARIDSTYDGQFYSLRSPFGAPLVQRERFTHTLGLELTNLQGAPDPKGPRLHGRVRLRLDADMGIAGAEVDPRRDDRFVPGLERAPFDLMYGYVEGTGFFDGVLGFRLGRQYSVGPLGWWSFDGALARVTTPAFFAVELFSGFEQRDGLFLLGTSRFEADGVWRGARTGMEAAQYPEFLNVSRLAPAYGFAVKTADIPVLDAQLAYRRVLNRDTVVVSPFPDPEGRLTTFSDARTSTERLGVAANASLASLGRADGRAVYDLYLGRPTDLGAGLTWDAADRLRLGASFDYYLPTYDGDSIFNWFSRGGTTTALSRVSWDATRRLALTAAGGVRAFTMENSDGADGGTLYDSIARGGSRYLFPEGELGASIGGEVGNRGRQAGGDVNGIYRFEDGLYDVRAFLSLYDFRDPFRPQRDATSFTYVLGGGVSPFAETRTAVEFEHSMNRIVGNRFRVLLSLDVLVQ